MNSELSHQALLLKVASANEGSERTRLTEQLKQEKTRTNQLQHDLDERTRQVIVLQAALQSKEAEGAEGTEKAEGAGGAAPAAGDWRRSQGNVSNLTGMVAMPTEECKILVN